jgi:hypothetical protein
VRRSKASSIAFIQPINFASAPGAPGDALIVASQREGDLSIGPWVQPRERPQAK